MGQNQTLTDLPRDASPIEDLSAGAILVVDDNQDSLRAAADVLELEGFSTISAGDGQTALALIDDQRPDLALLDVIMPGLSGIEVLKTIRARPDIREMPVILLTVLDSPIDVVHGLALGANDYLTKPVHNDILVARVRTQLRVKQLQDQRRLDMARLAELDMLKDRFLEIAVHDLKNPISNIMVGLDILTPVRDRLAEVFPDFSRVLNVMQTAASTMMMLVSDFLDHDMIHSGKLQLDVQAVDMNRLLWQTIEQFRSAARGKRIALETVLDPDLPPCQGDPNRLMQVASNLIGNAIKFSRPDDQVIIRTKVGDGMLRVEVEDNGPGISEKDRPQVFQEFARLRNRPTGGEKSSGLGLSIARQLIELHGGQIGVESTGGKGSVFWFELPG